MFRNTSQMMDAIKIVARNLGDLNDQVVYVGGAVAGFYADDQGAADVRPTKDVDIVLEIASLLELENIRQKLAERGIHFAQNEKVMCRFTCQHILVDVMATKEIGWAPANPWFKSGFDRAEVRNLDDVSIKIMSLPYYLASKFAAFHDRGSDPRTSHDFEDIVYVLDNRTTLINDILNSERQVKQYLLAELSTILKDKLYQEALLAHLEPATQTKRFEILIQKIKEITG